MPVAKTGIGANFQGLAQYLRSGRDGDSPDRIVWTSARNMMALRLEMAAKVMQVVAAENPRMQKPVYHLSIAWPEGEAPSWEAMEITVDRVLKDLKLGEHQAVLVAHNDTAHPHVHVMVNRVHPESYKGWSNANDWPRIEKTLRYMEQQMRWRRVQGRHTPAPTREDRTQGARPTSGETQQARRLGTPTPAQKIRDRAREVMRNAKSWPQLEYRLHQQGLSLRRSGRGLVVTDGKHYARASTVQRNASKPQLEKRFQQSYAGWRKERNQLRQLARQVDRFPARHETAARLERRLQQGPPLPEQRRRDLQRRADTLRGKRINLVKVHRRIRAFAVHWEERIVFWVSPTAGKVLRTYNRGTGALLRPVERGVERTLGRGR